MSDLISRNKLLESFGKSYCGHLGMENSDGMITFRSICRIINEQPTAYDIDKVVDELETEVERWEDSGKEYDDKCEIAVARGLRNAIEIVKQNSVSDDVCEWKYDEHFEFAKSDCDSMDTHRIDFKKLKYCPYCGKKIKVVK